MTLTSPLDLAIGDRVRKQREARGLTQAQMGKALGVSFQQVQKYERGTNRIASATLIRCAEVLDTSVAALCGEKDAAPEVVPFIREFTKLDDDQRKAVLNLIRVMVR